MSKNRKEWRHGDPIKVPGALSDQIDRDRSVNNKTNRLKQKRKRSDEDFEDDEQEREQVIDDRLSVKIIQQARQQQAEMVDELLNISQQSEPKGSVLKPEITKRYRLNSDNEEDEQDEFDLVAEEARYDSSEIPINEEDENILKQFMSVNPQQRKLLADIIQEKLTEKKTEIETQLTDKGSSVKELDLRITNMYEQVGEILSRYRSGKIPKAFKILPNLANWEQVLLITEPEKWTAASVYQATRLFASNMNAKMAQRFYNIILLPRIRDDIEEYKKLNFHLYMALRKALFKSSAFFKGIILPLCESGTCTLREAVIVSSIMGKTSVPMLHSAAALLKIAEMNYSGANSIFIRTLIEKRYALPFRVVDALVHHFIKFRTDERELPVLWHQALLSFVQYYRQDISTEQKQALLELIRHHCHVKIGPEIRKLLTEWKCRDEEDQQYAAMDDED
ncbi:unnamed protein product [Didymodactylos carnosus]|uniref:Bystin n=1 Tax=Didymodactylos carnosus TaxID=1234261 RepID=A0A8S2D5V9_9BILA|nr:unnamed protein product [Didymodactylos carnosus]CAF3630803.1 unnamed protein product [Didymodactylos carnosus]